MIPDSALTRPYSLPLLRMLPDLELFSVIRLMSIDCSVPTLGASGRDLVPVDRRKGALWTISFLR